MGWAVVRGTVAGDGWVNDVLEGNRGHLEGNKQENKNKKGTSSVWGCR
jgi:hypothetical protein